MNLQDVANIAIPEGGVRTIHDKDSRLLWGKLSYDTKYMGDSSQNGIPTPGSPVNVNIVTGVQTFVVTGKNLFASKYSQFDNAGGTGGTYNYFKLPTDGTYTLSLTAKNDVPATSNRNIGFTATGGSSTTPIKWAWKADSTATKGQVISITNEASGGVYMGYLSLYSKNETAFDWFIENFDIQLELGSATTYEPYQGQSYGVSLTGKNLFDINNLSATGITIENGVASGTAQSFNTAFGAAGISLPFNDGQYTISVVGYTDGNQSTEATAGLGFRVGYTDATFSNYVYWNNSDTTAVTKTFTTASGKTPEAIYFSFAGKGQNIWHLSQIQVEEGSSATGYVPYYDYGLCKIDTYQDYIYKSGSDWYVHKEIGKAVLTGSENWQLAGSSTNTSRFSMSASGLGLMSAVNGYCNSNVYVKSGVSSDTQLCGIVSGTLYYRVNHGVVGNADSLPQFKTWVASNNIIIYTALTTPTDTKITDATLIAQLDAVHQFLTRYGYNGTVSGNLPIIISKTNL